MSDGSGRVRTMRFYSYEGQCPGGTAISGTLEAESQDAAMAHLDAMGVQVVQLSQVKPPRPEVAVGYDDFIFFNEQLASLADAGVALDKGLREIARDIRGGRLRRVISQIADKLEQGVPLDQAVAAHESSLPVLYSRVIRAGIRSGQLPAALLNLSQHLRFIAQARRIVFEALSYPITVLFIALALFSLIMQWLIPQFEEIILDFNATVPLFSRCVFAFARAYPWLLMGVGIAAAAIIV